MSRWSGGLLVDRDGDLVLDRDLDLGDGDRRLGEGARWTDVGVCDLVLDRPRDGDLETILRRYVGNRIQHKVFNSSMYWPLQSKSRFRLC